MSPQRLLQHFDRIVEAPDAVPRLRQFILDLAVRGRLVEQDLSEEPASALLKPHLTIAAQQLPSNAKRVEQVPFALPSGWLWSRVRLIAIKTGSGSTPRGGKSVYKSHGVLFLRSQNIYNDGLRLDEVAYIDHETHDRMKGTSVEPGDLLLNITGGSIGRCTRMPDLPIEANISQHVAIIRLANSHMRDFMYRVVLLPFFQSFVINEQTGAGRGGLPKNRMDQIPVPIPPLAEQQRIVAKVDELMALCDRLEAAQSKREQRRDRLAGASLNRINQPAPSAEGEAATAFRDHARFHLNHLPRLTTRPEHIKSLRETILNLAVHGKLVRQDPIDESVRTSVTFLEALPDALPRSWRYARLEHLLAENSRNGFSRKPDDDSDGVPILRISAGTTREDGLVAEEEHKLISGIDAETRTQYGLMPGDLLACRFNGNKSFVGRLKLFRDYLGIRPIYPDKLIRVRVDPALALPPFVRVAGDSDFVRHALEAFCATIVGNWGISASKLKEVPFPVPPLAEQHRIVAKVDELMAVCDQLEAQLTTTQTDSRRLLEAVLHEALAPAMEQCG